MKRNVNVMMKYDNFEKNIFVNIIVDFVRSDLPFAL